ncbi:hypothetical protein ACWEV4_26915 [Streptomyces sp. NPDC003860]
MTRSQLIRDGDGLAVIGNQAAVEHFLVSKGLPSQALRPRPFRSALGNAAGAAQAGSDVAAHSSRWVKLSKESARSIDKYGLRESAKTGLSTGVLKGDRGQIKSFVEFAKGAGPFRGNPAVLANVAAMMAQLAMQQAMDEITDYLATIDEKVDDVRRAQEDDALSKMIGAEIVIDEVTIIRDEVGRVSDITWSKVQATSELHPAKSPAVVQSANRIVTGIEVFHGSLGIESGGRPSDTRRDDGRPRLARRGTRRWRPERRASVPPETWATRPWTGPVRSRTGLPAASSNERAAEARTGRRTAAGTRRSAHRRAERATRQTPTRRQTAVIARAESDDPVVLPHDHDQFDPCPRPRAPCRAARRHPGRRRPQPRNPSRSSSRPHFRVHGSTAGTA